MMSRLNQKYATNQKDYNRTIKGNPRHRKKRHLTTLVVPGSRQSVEKNLERLQDYIVIGLYNCTSQKEFGNNQFGLQGLVQGILSNISSTLLSQVLRIVQTWIMANRSSAGIL